MTALEVCARRTLARRAHISTAPVTDVTLRRMSRVTTRIYRAVTASAVVITGAAPTVAAVAVRIGATTPCRDVAVVGERLTVVIGKGPGRSTRVGTVDNLRFGWPCEHKDGAHHQGERQPAHPEKPLHC